LDALRLLKEDHDRVKKMLAEGESTTERGEKTREELFSRLKSDLEIHERMEEEVLYPALKSHPKAKELALEGYEEHHVVDSRKKRRRCSLRRAVRSPRMIWKTWAGGWQRSGSSPGRSRRRPRLRSSRRPDIGRRQPATSPSSTGRVKPNSAPPPNRSLAQTRPPIASIRCWHTKRPIPAPPGTVRAAGVR